MPYTIYLSFRILELSGRLYFISQQVCIYQGPFFTFCCPAAPNNRGTITWRVCRLNISRKLKSGFHSRFRVRGFPCLWNMINKFVDIHVLWNYLLLFAWKFRSVGKRPHVLLVFCQIYHFHKYNHFFFIIYIIKTIFWAWFFSFFFSLINGTLHKHDLHAHNLQAHFLQAHNLQAYYL